MDDNSVIHNQAKLISAAGDPFAHAGLTRREYVDAEYAEISFAISPDGRLIESDGEYHTSLVLGNLRNGDSEYGWVRGTLTREGELQAFPYFAWEISGDDSLPLDAGGDLTENARRTLEELAQRYANRVNSTWIEFNNHTVCS